MSKAIVLFSGGMDSTIALFWARARHDDVVALTIEYGQKHWIEISQASKIARRAKVRHEIDHMGAKGIGPRCALRSIGTRIDSEEAAIVPGRNLMFLAIASGWAESTGSDAIVAGFSLEDAKAFPDCRPAFVRAAQDAVSTSMDRRIRIDVPLITLSKSDALHLGASLPGCWESILLSWTCYEPRPVGLTSGSFTQCGLCPSCTRRAAAFAAAGLTDAALEARG